LLGRRVWRWRLERGGTAGAAAAAAAAAVGQLQPQRGRPDPRLVLHSIGVDFQRQQQNDEHAKFNLSEVQLAALLCPPSTHLPRPTACLPPPAPSVPMNFPSFSIKFPFNPFSARSPCCNPPHPACKASHARMDARMRSTRAQLSMQSMHARAHTSRFACLVRQQQADGFQALLASVHVVTEEEVVSFWRETSILE
jgi:hypothetical protein